MVTSRLLGRLPILSVGLADTLGKGGRLVG